MCGKLSGGSEVSPYTSPTPTHGCWPVVHTPRQMVPSLQPMNPTWHVIVPQSLHLALPFTLGVARRVGLDTCMMTCNCHCSITQSSFTAPQILCAPLIDAPPPVLSTWQPLIRAVSIASPVTECRGGARQQIAFHLVTSVRLLRLFTARGLTSF